jgi:hypothetical protein
VFFTFLFLLSMFARINPLPLSYRGIKLIEQQGHIPFLLCGIKAHLALVGQDKGERHESFVFRLEPGHLVVVDALWIVAAQRFRNLRPHFYWRNDELNIALWTFFDGYQLTNHAMLNARAQARRARDVEHEGRPRPRRCLK